MAAVRRLAFMLAGGAAISLVGLSIGLAFGSMLGGLLLLIGVVFMVFASVFYFADWLLIKLGYHRDDNSLASMNGPSMRKRLPWQYVASLVAVLALAIPNVIYPENVLGVWGGALLLAAFIFFAWGYYAERTGPQAKVRLSRKQAIISVAFMILFVLVYTVLFR